MPNFFVTIKLQKKYTPINTSTTTTYINEFVYTGDALSYINFEEGRIRVMTPVSQSNAYDALAIDGNMLLPNDKKGTYDFFIRDYQQNVRMILTEEIHNGYNTCTMESTRAGNEEPIFGQAGANNEVSQTRIDKPSGWASNSSASVSKLGNLSHKAGPNVLLKVMAGDQISATSQYYFQNNVTNSTGDNLTTDILATLVQSILGSSNTGLAKGNTTNITNQLGLNGSFTSITSPDANNPNGTIPKAYMTIMFFDERFNFVSEGSTALRVSAQGDNAAPLVLANIKSPKNGYAYVYLSNESNEPVYFDNFKVGDNRGRIIEEDHYYSFGLKIAAISSKKLPDANEGNIDNKNLYNDKELFDDADLDWYDYGFRNYDPQIGRFPQLDPLTDDYPHYTPYQYAGNEPIANVDMDGLEEKAVVTAASYMKDISFTVTKQSANVAVKAAVSAAGNGWKLFSKVASKVGEFIGDEVIPRVGGALKAVAGAAIMVAGAATSEFGVGIPVFAFGADYGGSGLHQIWDGNSHKTLTQQSLEYVGLPEDDASNLVEVGAGFLSMGAGSTSPTPPPSQTFERVMTKAELEATRETKLLRGGREGENFFSKAGSVSDDAKRAQQRLGLDNGLRTHKVKFSITDPKVKITGPRIAKAGKSGTLGGGIEYSTTIKTKIKILKVRKLKNTGT